MRATTVSACIFFHVLLICVFFSRVCVCVPFLKKLAHPCSSSSISSEQAHVLDTNRRDPDWDMHRRMDAHSLIIPPCPLAFLLCLSVSTGFHHGSFVCKMITSPLANYQRRIPDPLSPPCASLFSSSVCSADLWWNWSQGPADKWIEESFCDGRKDRGRWRGGVGPCLPEPLAWV